MHLGDVWAFLVTFGRQDITPYNCNNKKKHLYNLPYALFEFSYVEWTAFLLKSQDEILPHKNSVSSIFLYLAQILFPIFLIIHPAKVLVIYNFSRPLVK